MVLIPMQLVGGEEPVSYFTSVAKNLNSRLPSTRRCAEIPPIRLCYLRLEGAVFRGVYGEIFAFFQACVGDFDTTPQWKVVGTLKL